MTDDPTSMIDWSQPINWACPLNRGLSSRWPVVPNAGNGGKFLRDFCRNGHLPFDGTLTSGPLWSGFRRPGGYGSLKLDGSDDYINVPSFPILSIGATYSCWIYCTNVTANRTFFYFGGAGGSALVGVEVGRTSGRISVIAGSSVIVTGNTVISANQWYHVVVTRTPTGASRTYSIYVNGVFDNSGTGAIGTSSNTNGFIGQGITGGRQFPGYLDNPAIWSRDLSSREVMALYQDELAGSPQTLNWLEGRQWAAAAASSFKSAWARNSNTVIQFGGRCA